jgi:hypothetical protein
MYAADWRPFPGVGSHMSPPVLLDLASHDLLVHMDNQPRITVSQASLARMRSLACVSSLACRP